MRALHLFAGAGGSVLASRLLGWASVGSVEWDPYCRRVLRARGERVVGCDVRGFKATGLVGGVDVVVGGSPCQDLSIAGRRAGLDGTRSGLWWEQLRIAQECAAPFIWWENVRGALSSNGGRDFGVILHSLAQAGYDAVWTVNRASDVGAPHRRERVWVLAYRPEYGRRQGWTWTGERARGSGLTAGGGEPLAYSPGCGWRGGDTERQPVHVSPEGRGSVEHAACFSQREPSDQADAVTTGGEARDELGNGGQRVAFTGRLGLEERDGLEHGHRAHPATEAHPGRDAEPRVGRAPDGLANGMDWPAARGDWPHGKGPTQAAWESPRTCGPGEPGRVKRVTALGNGWVPAQAVAAWHVLWATMQDALHNGRRCLGFECHPAAIEEA
jgi:DNA (cytosine-5)-methyltransferase 1